MKIGRILDLISNGESITNLVVVAEWVSCFLLCDVDAKLFVFMEKYSRAIYSRDLVDFCFQL